MSKKLFFQAVVKFLLGIVIIAALIFIPAGTFNYLNGWIFMGILFIPMLIAGIVMMLKNPELLKSRLEAKEKQKEQGVVIKLSGLMFIVGFVLAGLDFRFKWISLPPWVTYVASGFFLLAYIMWAEVLRENTFLSRTIKVIDGQKVIDSGLYGVVRHPMYFATLILFLSMPLVLGSLVSFFVFLLYPILIITRIINEEKFLEKELEGYIEYKKKVKYRLIPFIW
ncbi:MAG: isoprenylcysteine carboxylmethyltransferase family protein [Bacilli bacterium]|nr:isoprenylcysteine carboxylmethyltransferase family protein [Bacilli bacterium]